MTLTAKWFIGGTGHKAYDAPVCSITTQFWTRGCRRVAVHVNRLRKMKTHAGTEPLQYKPAATCQLVFNFAEYTGSEGVLIAEDFEAESVEEVRAQVEAWAQAQMDRAVAALRQEFSR